MSCAAAGGGILALELIPAFSLYRGLYELAQSAFIGNYQGTKGTLTWSTLGSTGFAAALGILAIEWLLFLLLGLYLDQVVSTGSGVRKPPLFFLKSCFFRKEQKERRAVPRGLQQPLADAQVDIDKNRPDVQQEVCYDSTRSFCFLSLMLEPVDCFVRGGAGP